MKDLWLGLGELAREAWDLLLAANLELLHWCASLKPAAVACVAVLALTAAVIGARRPMVRLVAGAAGVGLGFAYAARFEPWLPFLHVSLDSLGWDLALVFGIFGAATPEGFIFGLSGLLFGSGLASLFRSSQRAFAFLPGFLLGGAAGVMAFPFVAALVSSFGGGWVCASALAALLPRTTLGGYFEAHPLATFGLGLAIGAAGFVGQLSGVHLGRLGVPTEGGPSAGHGGGTVGSPGKRRRASSN